MELIPKKEPQGLIYEQWSEHTPYGNKLELIGGKALGGGKQRDNMLMALIYNMGLEYFVSILPEESKRALQELL